MESNFGSMYEAEPPRPKRAELRIPSEIPWNHEPPLHVLTDSFLTPNDYFFVRNHNSVPDIEEEDYYLEIESNNSVGLTKKTLTLAELKDLPRHSVVSVIQCAGIVSIKIIFHQQYELSIYDSCIQNFVFV